MIASHAHGYAQSFGMTSMRGAHARGIACEHATYVVDA
jgi:hypothetical protein